MPVSIRNLVPAGLFLLTALGACGVPAQPDPPPGRAATLSPDVIPYDQVEFRTNRRPVIRPGQECLDIDAQLAARLGLSGDDAYRRPSQQVNGGCSFPDEDQTVVAGATQPFGEFWRANVKDQGVPGSMYTGLASFQRKILDGRYYAVEYVGGDYPEPYADQCALVVDVGSVNPLVVQIGPYRGTNDLDAVRRTRCARAEQLALQVLAARDPGGGSRVG
ncbi:hypothetical protein [Gandjariella thermophila]|uniref:hypothetical protein n=1 Tax=Gandjariella thermophila TaxID=1931992 RepID=UPI0010F969B6|nr:hypothetical protein [Gandjariella thermophila]